MILRELLRSPDLIKALTFYIHKLTEIIIVYKYWNFILAALQIVAPGFESVNNSQELTIVSFIPCFSQNHLPQKVGYRIILALIEGQMIKSQLIQNSSYVIT